MSKQLLIYNSAVPVSRQRHHDCSIEPSGQYAFSAGINSVPLTAVEFPQAVSEYPIVFTGSGAEIGAAAILGLRADENLFLGSDGTWSARYIPAFVRRYPFVFSTAEDRFVLCVDEQFPGFNREGRGQRFFDAEGEMTQYVKTVLTFLQDFQAQHQRTQAFCTKIEQLGLLEPMQAKVTVEGGETMLLSGFKAVNRAKLKALPATTLGELAQTDELEMIYVHLQSMNNFDALKDRIKKPAPAIMH